MLLEISVIIVAYLMGSVSSAIIVCRLMGLPDPRTEGSRNPGATNVLRIGTKKAAAFTLAGDAIKGILPVLLAQMLDMPAEVIAGSAIAAFLGHLYPVFFGFKGGKGVATALGVYLAISLPVGLLVAGTWFLVARITKISSLSALVAAAVSPIYVAVLLEPQIYIYMAIFLATLLVYRHKSNIQDLISGREGKISDKN